MGVERPVVRVSLSAAICIRLAGVHGLDWWARQHENRTDQRKQGKSGVLLCVIRFAFRIRVFSFVVIVGVIYLAGAPDEIVSASCVPSPFLCSRAAWILSLPRVA